MVVQQAQASTSEHPSVHSVQSHLRPDASRSASHSAPSSGHSYGGSASSRPSAHSQEVSVRSDLSYSSASEEARSEELGELGSPPLSAVMGSFGSAQRSSRSPSSLAQPQSPNVYITPASSRAPLLGGTVTSQTTTGTDTNSSVTTALTDPITGAVMHFPSLPWAGGRETVRRVESWHNSNDEEERWS